MTITRTKLIDRKMPDYTRAEELFNMISHIVGAAFGIVALVLCVVHCALRHNVWGVVSSSIYGSSLIVLYCMSSIYHGLPINMGKRVLQVLDHCTIYFLIGGTYTPILLCSIRPQYPGWAWSIFGVVWGISAFATVFTAIDLKKYSKLSMICYIGIGWCIVIAIKPALATISARGIFWILAGGIAYTVGAVLYGLGKKHRYMHSVFHLFVLAGSVLQFFAIYYHIL